MFKNIIRLIELDRLTVNTREKERVEGEETRGVDPDLVTRKPSETRGGVMEKLIKICEECGVDMSCHGNCSKFDYDLHKEDILDRFNIQMWSQIMVVIR